MASKINMNKTMLRHIIIKMLKTSVKQRILRATKEKDHILYSETNIKKNTNTYHYQVGLIPGMQIHPSSSHHDWGFLIKVLALLFSADWACSEVKKIKNGKCLSVLSSNCFFSCFCLFWFTLHCLQIRVF